ncbi:MAG: SDR family oxidoreductase [Anaerolineae bacterium]
MLDGRIVVVTGANQGLGEAIAQKFADAKATVWLVARNAEKLEVAAKKINAGGGVAKFQPCDLADIGQVKSCVATILAADKQIDILINNAAMWIQGDIAGSDPVDIQKVFDVNAVGNIYITQAAVEGMKAAKSGQVININSLAGIEADKNWPVYSATKYAMRGFSEALKADVEGTGIKVSDVYPGGINTNLYTNAGLDIVDQPWMMKKEDIAEIILTIASQPADIVMDHVEIRKVG